MRELMREREHLGGLRVGGVDEDQRCKLVGQREAAELIGVELPAVVVADDAAHHDEDAAVVGARDEAAEGFGPCGRMPSFVEVELQVGGDATRSLLHGHGRRQRSDEGQNRLMFRSSEVAVPFLALLTDVDRVESIGAGASHALVADRAEVRNRNCFDGRFAEEQESDRRVCRAGEVFELLQRGTYLAALPFGQFWEALRERCGVNARALARPLQEFRLDFYSHNDERSAAVRVYSAVRDKAASLSDLKLVQCTSESVARTESSNRLRARSEAWRLAPSWSHSAISSLAFETIRVCSSGGGTGTGYALIVATLTRGAAPPVVLALAMFVIRGEFRTSSRRVELTSAPERISIILWPRHKSTPFGIRQATPRMPPSRL